MKEKLSQYKHLLLLLYFPVYMLAFCYLEKVTPERVHIINCTLDQYIPFMEIFIVPYLLWFAYMGVTAAYFAVFEKDSFCKMMFFGYIGMTIFIIVSFCYPNGLEIRPTTFPRENIFTQAVQYLYRIDTATNVLPSIHVFNSVASYCAIKNSSRLKRYKVVQNGAFILTVLIVLSTMFLKQHSIFDVLSGLALAYLSYELIYNERALKIKSAVEELKYRKKVRYKNKLM